MPRVAWVGHDFADAFVPVVHFRAHFAQPLSDTFDGRVFATGHRWNANQIHQPGMKPLAIDKGFMIDSHTPSLGMASFQFFS